MWIDVSMIIECFLLNANLNYTFALLFKKGNKIKIELKNAWSRVFISHKPSKLSLCDINIDPNYVCFYTNLIDKL